MNTVKCGVEECPSVFQTEEPLSPNAKYICKHHTSVDQKVHFQWHQFDRNMNRAGTPVGTSHIPHRQGTPQPEGFCPEGAAKEKK